jgi:hypothetical protein
MGIFSILHSKTLNSSRVISSVYDFFHYILVSPGLSHLINVNHLMVKQKMELLEVECLFIHIHMAKRFKMEGLLFSSIRIIGALILVQNICEK